ncbi:MAG: nucleoside-diphosphate sugar epimerase/dehydratase [Lachnospiraceae bacterium]|nr:nucleoside-diphosphate sugar epimerase/dehydratase [Lachnospiraceae bacterium]
MDQHTLKREYRFRIEHWKAVRIMLLAYDMIAVNLSYFLALWFRFDCRFTQIPQEYWTAFLRFVLVYTGICLFVFWRTRLYQSIWRFAGYNELLRVLFATVITSSLHTIGITLCFVRMPVSYYIMGFLIQVILIIGIRFAYRFVLLIRSVSRKNLDEGGQHVMIIGAGAAGHMLIKDIAGSKRIRDKVCCIIDDDPNKWNHFIEGIPVVGGKDDILVNCEKYKISKIYFAIPSASAEEKREIFHICKETGCELKRLPGIYQIVNDEVTVSAMKDVSIEDLLGRETIRIEMDEVFDFIRGKRILVTGGGGSIGSELCRQIAAHQPEQLIIFDIYENNAYDIQLDLQKKYPNLDLQVRIGSVRDSRMLCSLFETYRPEVIYHAAAHKHVPLMEDSPCEAIKNNAAGTYKTAYAAMVYGCKRFVLISTDKAVNPTNIMGASKRLCEMVIQAFDRKIKEGKADEIPQLFTHEDNGFEKIPHPDPERAATEYVAVRFGNVLGSNGSVIPLFKKQIAEGGPVTVTHPDIIRYFMTIPEAVSLVLRAGTNAEGGEIFVLDMGSPVKIDTLARNLIKLSGFQPDVDIKIQYSGLRPGEKLYEEKLMAEEGLKRTENERIHIGCPIPFDADRFLKELGSLVDAAYENREDIRDMTVRIVPTYQLSMNLN